jgi:DNA-binding MarR family transcriptional regulator
MPEKIKPAGSETTAQSLLDILFSREAGLTDEEARALYAMWRNSPVGARHLAALETANSKAVNALKTKGYVAGYGDTMVLTEKGKKVIVEMVTHEPNTFNKKANDVSYSGIKAKNAKSKSRPRQAFKKQAGADGKPSGKVFNLRKESVRRLQGQA